MLCLQFNSVSAQIKNQLKSKSPIVLESLTPKLDPTAPAANKLLEGLVQDSYYPEVLSIPKSGFTKAYDIGRQLFADGDYARAANAFKLSLLRARLYGDTDPRTQMAMKAAKMAESHINLASRLGLKMKDTGEITGTVEKVFPPSLAWLASIKSGDEILKAQTGKSDVTLILKRDKQIFKLSLKIPATNEAVPDTMSDITNGDGFGRPIKHPELLESATQLLRNYDCYLVIDVSGSMDDMLQQNGKETLSKWSWCQRQSTSFYKSAERLVPQGITIVPFNQDFSVVPNCRKNEIKNLFSTISPCGGTDVAGPLNYIMNRYLDRKQKHQKPRPIALAVLTDGECGLREIADSVIDATQKMTHPKEIVITFLSVGDTTTGSPVLRALDDELVAAGAKFDIVDTRSFDELSRFGLTKVLAAALIEERVEK